MTTTTLSPTYRPLFPLPSGRPVDPALNRAVLRMAAIVCPGGYDVSARAPSSYRELVRHLDGGGRMTVYDGGSEGTIFADNEVNYAFRAWHDWTHWRHLLDFSTKGELLTWRQQVTDLQKVYGVSAETSRWARLLYADIVGQRTYYDLHGDYVRDQAAFSTAFLACPTTALATPGM